MRPRRAVSRDRDLCDALFDVLEAQNLIRNPNLRVTVIPSGGGLLAQLEAARKGGARGDER